MVPVGLNPQPPVRPERERHRLFALLVGLVFLTGSFSGCIGLDFFLPRAEEEAPVSEGDGMVRVWLAAKPGGLGPEFAFFNLSFTPPGHIHDVSASRIALMQSEAPTIDLLKMEREQKAALLGSLVVPPGGYYGFTFRVVDVNLTLSEVVGNDNGTEVVRYLHPGIAANTAPGLVRFKHDVMPDSVTDLYLEVDVEKSLLYEDGSYAQQLQVVGISYYINGFKAGGERWTHEPTDPTGVVDARQNRNLPAPTARFELRAAETDDLLYDSWYPHKRVEDALGIGQDVRLNSRSFSNIRQQGEAGRIVEMLWNFGDGTSHAGGGVVKNWTDGGIYEVSLTVRDEYDQVARTFGTVWVPYRADEAVTVQRDARAGTLPLGSASGPIPEQFHRVEESLSFPRDLEQGGLFLGGYRVVVHFSDASGGLAGAGTTMRMDVASGHLETRVQGTSPLVVETAGMPFWRGPATPWVDTEIDVSLELLTGAQVSYDLTVEALYYENATLGFDPHATHRHGDWYLGPRFAHLDHEGRVRAPEES